MKRKIEYLKNVENGIEWIVKNTIPRTQWEAILLLSYLSGVDKNKIERTIRKQRGEREKFVNKYGHIE